MTLQMITMYIYHSHVNALSTHMIHINLNTTFQTHGTDLGKCTHQFRIFSNCCLSFKIYNILCVIVYCDVVNVQPHFNFSDEIIK